MGIDGLGGVVDGVRCKHGHRQPGGHGGWGEVRAWAQTARGAQWME